MNSKMSKKICIIGAKQDGSSKVVLDIIRLLMKYEIVGFFDDDAKCHGKTIEGIPIIGVTELLKEDKYKGCFFSIAFGNNHLKHDMTIKLIDFGLKPENLFHPTSVLAQNITLGNGIWAAANVVVNPGCKIYDGVVLNTAATMDHDCLIESFVNISPGCHLSGRTKVGKFAFLGTGVVTIPDTQIGQNSIVGAGSVVIKNVPDNVTVAGIPAKVISK